MQLSAACIYVAARQLRVNLMLLDLSDAVAVNVYQVGRTYVDLKRKLNLSLPEVGKRPVEFSVTFEYWKSEFARTFFASLNLFFILGLGEI
ncbi:unnamed protein product [Dibothriocephalus latus]|uniref:Transcription factor TFIIB cyclin-like domain-containing protein n=1 Tax=Dibothriocephalus latus TaxID=60516 RepID=A0A3P7LAJ3_DIBLA|nr:unnamed protein product [Dibothriocephalus latus]